MDVIWVDGAQGFELERKARKVEVVAVADGQRRCRAYAVSFGGDECKLTRVGTSWRVRRGQRRVLASLGSGVSGVMTSMWGTGGYRFGFRRRKDGRAERPPPSVPADPGTAHPDPHLVE